MLQAGQMMSLGSSCVTGQQAVGHCQVRPRPICNPPDFAEEFAVKGDASSPDVSLTAVHYLILYACSNNLWGKVERGTGSPSNDIVIIYKCDFVVC